MTKFYGLGLLSAKNGGHYLDCPFKMYSEESEFADWHRGWIAGHKAVFGSM